MKTIIFPKPIYPDLDSNILEKSKTILSKYGIEIKFLIDSGIAFLYNDDLEPRFSFFGDLSFVRSSNKSMVIISFTENFNELEFKNGQGELILTIPILE